MQRWQRVIENKNDSFHLLIQDKMGVQRGKSHNEHSKYPMSTSRRFYTEWAPRPMSLVFSEHMSNSAFPQTSEAWLSQDSILWMPLIKFLLPRSPFQVFNLGIFCSHAALSSFRLDLSFSFLWFKLPFQVFTLNPLFFCQNRPFGFSILTSLSSDGIKHNTSWLCQHW